MDFILTLPAPVRHLVLIVTSVTLAWLGTDVVGPLQDQPGYGPLAAGLLTAFLAYATPLVASYGVGSKDARDLGARQPR